MKQVTFDVIVIGAGPAGVAAAGALAGAGISVALLETGVYAGAENWSGCVYFTESLAEIDCFGPDAVEAAPFERRVVRRGTLIHNGLDEIGVAFTDAQAFRNCYTVLRPVYDPYFAELARAKGAVHLTQTTVTALIRKDGRVVGVDTNRGPLYADTVFIAEGDASHLVRSEGLERVPNPHYLQGVKAVLSLPAGEIEKRFGLGREEGAAFEILIRNASIAGRTAKLNVGGFLYTNRDSLSIGYVAPLDNIRNNFRGDHDRLFEWMRQLPYIKELADGAALSAYGTKIVRSGGMREQPILVEDGLVVGGASAGLGVDIPFPNFTGPAAATGLIFARAMKNILSRGRTPDAKNLKKEYLAPLRESIYGRNAHYLSRWPGYFGQSKALFGRTADLACGTARFLTQAGLAEQGRFLRGHLLSPRGLRELTTDTVAAVRSLKLGKRIIVNILHPTVIGSWCLNLLKPAPAPDTRLAFILNVAGKKIDRTSFRAPLRGPIRRLSPPLACALNSVYANDGVPAEQKFSKALRIMMRSFRLTDFIVLPAYGLVLLLAAAGTAVWDAFRYYVLKTPVEELLREPVMAYAEAQRKARDLDAVKPLMSLEAKLATNTYRVGALSHIRTLWPEAIKDHADMARAGLWWACPARVYVYDAPPLAGRGRVAVNFENCIKCESCWRAEPARVLWGRHTDHKLIYRPESAALTSLIASRTALAASPERPVKLPVESDVSIWYPSEQVLRSSRSALRALEAFLESAAKLPASADASRRSWDRALGKRLGEKLGNLEIALANDNRRGQAQIVNAERQELEKRLAEGRLFHALYSGRRIGEMLRPWSTTAGLSSSSRARQTEREDRLSYAEASSRFPDRIVKQWEEGPIPREWAETLRTFINEHRGESLAVVRALSSVNPALGLIAAHQLTARHLLSTETGAAAGICAVSGKTITIREDGDSLHLTGALTLVPLAASESLLIITGDRGYLVPRSLPGVTVALTPAIGFRAAGLADVSLDCTIPNRSVEAKEIESVPDAASYCAIALGAGDYLSRRVQEHALGRVQFPGQMLDTEGRDGIAKLGAVKALIARTGAWRLLLETLFDQFSISAPLEPRSSRDFDLMAATVAASAFSPEPGAMGYDAGQVFGGFAYSEDDLLSRFYRDSALFRFLTPGFGAAAQLRTRVGGADPGTSFPFFNRIDAVQGEPLGHLASRLKDLTRKVMELSPKTDAGLAGQAQAVTIALHALLAAVDTTLNSGRNCEAEAAAVEVLLGAADEALHKAEASTGRGMVSPLAVFPIEPTGRQVTLESTYESFCTAPGMPHKSGSFLTTAFDRAARFVPEMQLHDPKLAARWAELSMWFKQNCRDRKFDGLPLERAIEKKHRIPDEVIEAVKDNKWLATYVPQTVDGLGWHKAEYYILNSVAGSFGDAAINLLIMASTSIGTTPILLGLEEELPRVREELEPLIKDEQRLGEIGSRLSRIITSFANPNPSWIKKEYEAVMKITDDRIRRTRVVKYLAANFLRAFYGAGIAGRRGDFGGFISNLQRAGELFDRLMLDIRAALDELPRRERCHKLFLRSLGHNGVSAFALTEPTAGSDSGGVKTTARLRSSTLAPLEDGRYVFYLDDGDEKTARYLIDADRIAFVEHGVAYRTPDDEVVPIRYDKYDYATDQGMRSYVHRGKECPFHDIGQVRRSPDGLRYEYYVLTGAKMWITNASIATQFCLYAQTPEGVTGFLVDRHAEGLKVGADEKKTGQRGSPTNEISIDNVRVPREAVIGYEGHGQVNALETLNVGRCGLAVVSGALMRKLMQEAAAAISPSPERDNLLGEAAAVLFGSESLAYYLVGLFDRPHESVRMESAVAKYACSEDIHELLSLVEYAFGPVGQTETFLLEKARRDSRILTIYEGTNEVQRFLILKDLVAQASSWPELPVPQHDERAATLVSWKNMLRRYVKEAAASLGDACWADAMLQPALFPLAEMAAEVLRLECIYYRTEWLDRNEERLAQGDPGYGATMRAAGTRAAERTLSRLGRLQEKFSASWELTQNNMDMPEVRAADAFLAAQADKTASPLPSPGVLRAPLRMLVIVRPIADLSPHPRVKDGEIRELVWRLDPSDLSALDQALALKAASASVMHMDVLMPGGVEQEMLLRMAAGAGADSLIRLDADSDSGPAIVVKALRDLEVLHPYDLILTGADCRNGDQALGAYIAGVLKRYHYRRERIEVKPDGTGLVHVALPSVITITTAATESLLTMTEAVSASFTQIRTVTPNDGRSASSARFVLPGAAESDAKTITSPDGAADSIRQFAATATAAAAPEFTGEIISGDVKGSDAVWAVLDPREQKSNLAVLRGARYAAEGISKWMGAVIPAPRGLWPKLLGLAQANGCEKAFCVDTNDGRLSNDGKRALIRLLMKPSGNGIILAGTEWASSFAFVAGEAAAENGIAVLLCSGVTAIQRQGADGLIVSVPAYEGKLVKNVPLKKNSAFITIAPEAEFPAPVRTAGFKAIVLDMAVDNDWIMPLAPVAPLTLSQADVIIDLGYGIKDLSGFELARELKKRLEARGLTPMFGATRKVTQDLKLLPLESQIGQTGVRVNPKLILALGISGAPQHIDYLGTRTEVLCFNKDPEAPLMKLNQTRPAPRVHPIAGDLFVTVKELIEKLG